MGVSDDVNAGAKRERADGVFDANAHPDIGTSPSSRTGKFGGNSYRQYVETARVAGFVGACAVALPQTDPVDHFEQCRQTGFLTPVAPWRSVGPRRVGRNVQSLARLGYRAIKVHPRLGGPALGSREFRSIAQASHDNGCVLFVCTYPLGRAGQGLGDSLLADLEVAVAAAPATRMVLLHGGAVDLLRYIEFCRANEHLLLDLSWTLMKYAKSSIDEDLAYAFSSFDSRVCVGTDYPWYSPSEVLDRLGPMLRDLDAVKRSNILHANIEDYLAG